MSVFTKLTADSPRYTEYCTGQCPNNIQNHCLSSFFFFFLLLVIYKPVMLLF
uniref:Uncharacterized protein n=1 Tax=Anguilla anguilla TaxID=7936 RepID=A0A0E9PNG6_ANGAN